ncbi:polyprenyl synthetase family protein [Parvularcula oceani]|uniref:polyprenyl synthetase family protein n=1 Tax=Parvularcula oceani TaxID=1247963 RepID=UPI001EE393B4|nr:polyprenyl synthetase family protein [Parvularcula oceani]
MTSTDPQLAEKGARMGLAAEIATREPFADVAARLKAAQSRELDAVGEVILEHLDSSVSLIPEVARHLMGAGGKRLRPLMTLSAAQVCGYQGASHHHLAAAVELIHAATLLHDDVVDESALRRGLRTANIVFGNKESVLVGDFLFARSFELMVKTGSLKVLDILSQASCTISEGEVLQLATQSNVETTQKMYIDVISAKTAALFGAATHAGAVLADAPERQERALADYGMNFGIAYQIVDDALDYEGTEEATGKSAGDDFREGKMTLPVILAIEAARSGEERAFWQRTIGEGQREEDDFARAQELMARDGLVERSLSMAEDYAEAAATSLGALPPSRLRDTLEDLALSSSVRAS